jgi:hypothetical protein
MRGSAPQRQGATARPVEVGAELRWRLKSFDHVRTVSPNMRCFRSSLRTRRPHPCRGPGGSVFISQVVAAESIGGGGRPAATCASSPIEGASGTESGSPLMRRISPQCISGTAASARKN